MTQWDDAISAIAGGELVVLPTDTVYGIGCDPFSAVAVARLLGSKGRGETMPPPVLAADTAQALELADWDRLPQEERDRARTAVEELAAAFWPGGLTLIVPTSQPFGWDTQTHGMTVAIRVPDEATTREILRRTGPLAVTSANLTGMAPALTVAEARDYFGGAVRCYLDGGAARVGEASTIVDCTVNPPRPIRMGALDWGKILLILEGDEGTDLGHN